MSSRDLKALTDTALTMTTYRKAIPCIDNSHREEFQSSSGGTSVFLQLIAVSSRGLLVHFYRQSRHLVQSVRVFIYLDHVPSLSTI